MAKGSGGTRGASGGGRKAFRGDASMRGYSAALAKAVKAREDEIRGLKKENLSIFDDEGNELFRNVGTGARVSSSPLHEPNHIVTHNHPGQDSKGMQRSDNGGSLSRNDIFGSIANNAKEIRAVTSTYTYSLKRPSGGWRMGGWKGDKFIGGDAIIYKRAKQAIDAHDRAYYASYKGNRSEAARRISSTFWHRVNKEFARTVGYEYTKQKVN